METKNNIYLTIKGLTISIILTLAFVILFALIIKNFDLPDSCITPVNYVIKAICIALGVFVMLKDKQKGLKKGVMIGGLYIATTFIIFSILNRTFDLSLKFLLELVLGSIFGGICGIAFVNLKKT